MTTLDSGVLRDRRGLGVPAMRHGPHAKKPTRYSVGSMVLGTIGEILITIGLILGLYVVWELVWTNVEADQIQQEYQAAFQAEPNYVPPKLEVVGTTAQEHRDAAPEVERVPAGQVFANLWVPRWNSSDEPYKKTVAEGIDKKTVLDGGVGIGHYPETQMPGQIGNFAVAAHRSTYGKSFQHIDQLQVGDAVVVETDKYWFVYKITDSEIVNPGDVQVIGEIPTHANGAPIPPMTQLPADMKPEYAYITLTTCHPYIAATHRYIQWGVLDYWMDKAEGTPKELSGN